MCVGAPREGPWPGKKKKIESQMINVMQLIPKAQAGFSAVAQSKLAPLSLFQQTVRSSVPPHRTGPPGRAQQGTGPALGPTRTQVPPGTACFGRLHPL